jgi:ATP-dependent RNA helicase RhlB
MFGFLKKLISKIIGAKDEQKSQVNGKRKHPNGKDRNRSNNNRGAKGNAPQRRNDRQEAGKRNGRGNNLDRRGNREENSRKHQHQDQQRHSKKHGARRDDRRENMRGQDRSQRPQRPQRPHRVNTAAGEMRPGGVVSDQEQAARKALHEAWNPASFVVESVEGKQRFHDFDLPSEVMHGIADLGFQYCTDIQALSLKHALEGKNIAGKAQTGSGKTAAFLVAIFTRYLRTPESRSKSGATPRALVIAPTRELVIQICKDADAIGKYCALRSLAIYGGMDFDRQREELINAPVDLLVATPGRLLDFCQRRVINLGCIDTLVIDEADRMLDMGFIPDVTRIMSYLPSKEKRATMLYSATLSEDVMRLASRWMEEPVRAEVESEHNATDTVRQVVYVIRAEDKLKVLFNHIALHPEARAIVFCNRKTTTEDVAMELKARGVQCEMLSGDVGQNKRLSVLENFRSGKIKIVIATDVAGRGIHVDDIDYVINFDFPYEAEDYVHRIGRTGRAGNTGIAISFADEDESFAIPDIEDYIKEPLKCTLIQEDDPLLKELPPKAARGEKAILEPVDEAAKAAVDAREAVTEEQKAAAAAIVGGLRLRNAAGREAFISDEVVQRKMPTFENALEVKPMRDESDVYIKPVEQKKELEEWVMPTNKEEENQQKVEA